MGVHNSESTDRDRPSGRPAIAGHAAAEADQGQALTEAAIGSHVRVLEVGADADRSARHGIRRGVALVVESDAPLGGPRIVRVGAARIAIARSLARAIRVRTVSR
jgi:Fe2+ transport system protein FeoA